MLLGTRVQFPPPPLFALWRLGTTVEARKRQKLYLVRTYGQAGPIQGPACLRLWTPLMGVGVLPDPLPSLSPTSRDLILIWLG